MDMFRAHRPLIVAAAAWLGILAGGPGWFLRYQSVPQRLGAAPAAWPAAGVLRPAPGRSTLPLFLHPRCPCGRASLEEFSQLQARYGGKADLYVLLVRPPGAPEDRVPADLRPGTSVPPGVQVLIDEEGREAGRFGAETSGLVLLYNPEGRLSFQGGITAGRGHQGENRGLRAVADRPAGLEEAFASNDVFGRPLFGDARPGGERGTE